MSFPKHPSHLAWGNNGEMGTGRDYAACTIACVALLKEGNHHTSIHL